MKKFIKTQNLAGIAAAILLCGSIFISCKDPADKSTTEINTMEVKKDTLPPLDPNNKDTGRTEVIVNGKTPPTPAQ